MGQGQGMLFLQMALVGALVCVFFDTTRALRRVFRHHSFWVQVEDLLFWAVTTLAILYFILNHAGGELRFFYLLGMGLGAVLYFATASPWVMRLFVWGLRVKVQVFRWLVAVLRQLVSPFVKLWLKALAYVKRRVISASKTSKQRVQKTYHRGKNYGTLKWVGYKTKQQHKRTQREQLQLARQREQARQARQAHFEARLRKAREKDDI